VDTHVETTSHPPKYKLLHLSVLEFRVIANVHGEVTG
jgi:hypothetical protein